MRLFNRELCKARFIERPNRFVITCEYDGKVVKAFLPNPGRLWELLLPGTTVYLEKNLSSHRKTQYTAVSVVKDNCPVMIHTHKSNVLAQFLIENDCIAELQKAEVLKKEVTFGKSRFDLLLRHNGQDIVLEVKSCTLFNNKLAMFPDAVTKRGKRHVEELASLTDGSFKACILFLIYSPEAEFFLPEFHIDPEFASSLYKARDKVMILPVSAAFDNKMNLLPKYKKLLIPWDILETEVQDRGSYCIILQLDRSCEIEVGALGIIHFEKGYYIYVGSAMKELSKRIKRHQRLKKHHFWHIDYLRDKAEFFTALPIRSSRTLECLVAEHIRRISQDEIKGFGASDCTCQSHLFYMDTNPILSHEFIKCLLYFRMDRLIETRRSGGSRSQEYSEL